MTAPDGRAARVQVVLALVLVFASASVAAGAQGEPARWASRASKVAGVVLTLAAGR